MAKTKKQFTLHKLEDGSYHIYDKYGHRLIGNGHPLVFGGSLRRATLSAKEYLANCGIDAKITEANK